ncbi:bifunctional diaminohydroxyphosphoribosylaminopyrimidine deaminase/5-amino-6-(5-phosphoribosylamino)uracil reductase RibD [Aliidiomarina haloalkalitolerans]|nr:bifunctional diaminohydroxyphosphoribosylaminopyrimidine deaminase/5-amino-6-(5-phosphoribosylamino)uracil reductase RibD [Aliidiomarina haloalkalitolerans]
MTNMPFTPADQFFMQYALELAARGRFTTHPNPNVGCVIVAAEQVDLSAGPQQWRDCIVGAGFHERAGGPHAEVFALRAAGDRARGATAYVTLEPCSHHGRTPPCAEALLKAAVGRVVVAMQDPFPAVSGRGIELLRNAGIQVDVGLLSDEAFAVSAAFFTKVAKQRPFVQVKLAASMDGKTALASGESKWITSPQARRDVQVGRAQAGAILSGAGTVLADDPSLNVRVEEFPADVLYFQEQPQAEQLRGSEHLDPALKKSMQAFAPQTGVAPKHVRQPLRVIIDHRGEISPQARIFQDQNPVWIVRTQALDVALPAHAQEIIVAAGADGKVSLPALLEKLATANILSVWVESGARLAGALLDANLVDELILYQAPKFLGSGAKELLTMTGPTKMAAVQEWQVVACQQVGPDLKITMRPDGALAK